MYAISNASRVYITSFFLLCSAFFLAPTVNAAVYTIDDAWHEFNTLKRDVDNAYRRMTNRPPNTTLVSSNSPLNISKNATGGLSASTNQILKTLDQPSSFTSTNNYSVASAKTALKSCMRSSACAGRALGAGAIIYEGINAWKDVYDLTIGQDGTIYAPQDFSAPEPSQTDTYVYPYSGTVTTTLAPLTLTAPKRFGWENCFSNIPDTTLVMCANEPTEFKAYACRNKSNGLSLVGFLPDNTCQYYGTDEPVSNSQIAPVSSSQLDDYIDEGYSPEVSDAPIVLTAGGPPETISLSTPSSAELPSTTTTNTDSQGKTTTTVKNAVITYNILNNNSSSPSIESTITETSNTYDDTANLVGSMTSTTTNNAVAPDPLPPSSGASADIEIPPFCTWASIVCDWIGWTKEGIEGEEPDLINLISEFEPDDNQYNSGIGSGSCPSPISLNLLLINETVEISYQPFCDFLDMIRPLVIAGAWLLSAFMYVGVLRRG